MPAINFRVPEEEFNNIQKAAAAQGQTVSDFVRAAVSKEMASASGLCSFRFVFELDPRGLVATGISFILDTVRKGASLGCVVHQFEQGISFVPGINADGHPRAAIVFALEKDGITPEDAVILAEKLSALRYEEIPVRTAE